MKAKSIFLSIIAFLLLTAVGEVNPVLRSIVLIFSYSSLSYLFIKKYGLEFNKYPKIPKELIYFFLLLFSSMVISSVFSKHVMIGFYQIIKISTLFYIIYLFYGLIESYKDLIALLFGLLAASSIMALSTFYQLFKTGFDFLELNNPHSVRSSGLLSNVNAIAIYFVCSLPILFIFLYKEKIIRKKILIWVLTIINILGLLVVTSRAGMIAILGSIVFITSILKPKLLVKILIVSVILFAVIFFSSLSDYLQILLRYEEGLSQRNYLWQLSWDMIKNNIITGVGPGSWGLEMFNYYPVMLDSFQGQAFIELSKLTEGFNNSHNIYLVFLSDMGIFGLITIIYLPIAFFTISYKAIRNIKNKNRDLYLILIGASACGVGMFIRGIFEGIGLITYGWLTVDLPFWILFAIITYIYQNHENIVFG